MNSPRQGKWIAGGFILTLALMAMISFASYRETNQLIENANKIDATYEIVDNLTNFYANMTVAESGRRGYIATGNQQELVRHRRAITSMKSGIQLLEKQLEYSNQFERDQMRQLRELVHARLALLQQSIEIYKPDRFDNSLQQEITLKSVLLRDKIQSIIAYLKAEKKRALRISFADSRQSIRSIVVFSFLGTFSSFTIISSVYYIVYFQEKQRQKIEKAKQDLIQEKELLDLKIRLFSMISHEFRTPLSVILSSSQLLEETYYRESNRGIKNIYRIQASVKLMNQFLTDILILTRAEAGNLSCNLEPLDIEAFCLNLVEDIQFLNIREMPIKFISEDYFTRVYLDEKLLYSILSNLLLNAIKYSPKVGEITLTLGKESETITFQVKDRGIGILAEDREHIYEPFYRGKNVENILGTGLGLAVVKKCVELHRGEISLTSELGKGTTFIVKIPITHS